MATKQQTTAVAPATVGGALKNPFVGNVSNVTPLPSEQSKGRGSKKGRLQFDACFEAG